LDELYFCDSDARLLGEALAANSTLTKLSLGDDTTLSVDGARLFSEGLGANKSLVKLFLGECAICGSGSTYLAQALQANATLASLKLFASRKFGSSGVAALANVLTAEKKPTLLHLAIMGPAMDDDAAAALGRMLAVNKTLQSLNLGFHRMTAVGLLSLAVPLGGADDIMMANKNSALSLLDLSQFPDGMSVPRPKADAPNPFPAIANMLAANRTLTKLNLASLGIDSDAVSAIATAISTPSSSSRLRELDLSCNHKIGDAGAVAIARAIHQHHQDGERGYSRGLVGLRMRSCAIGPAGAAALAGRAPCESSLQFLDLSINPLGADGVTALAQVLVASSKALEVLKLQTCMCGDKGVSAVAAALQAAGSRSGLRELIIGNNGVGNDSATHLAAGLRNNCSLTLIDMSPSATSEPARSILRAAIKPGHAEFACVALTAAQRLAVLAGGRLSRQGAGRQPAISRIPPDVVRRILTQYRVAQGRRMWDSRTWRMTTKK
jgi:hypothetical protein